MKKITFLLLAVICCLAACDNKSNQPAVLQGHMQGYDPQDKVLLMFGEERDTLQFDSAGNFTFQKVLQEPSAAFVYCLTNGRGNSGFQVYMENGKTVTVEMVPDPEETRYSSYKGQFSGDNQDVNEYLAARNKALNTPDTTTLVSFKAYRASVEKFQAEDLKNLQALSNKAFIEKYMKDRDQEFDSYLLYYPTECRQYLGRQVDDPDFVAFLKDCDFNDIKSINKIQAYLNYCQQQQGDRDEDDMSTPTLNAFQKIKELSTNQAVIDSVADLYMHGFMIYSGGGEELRTVYEAYEKTSKNQKNVSEIGKKVKELLKLCAGSPATDFTMKDRDGKEHHFLDVIGHGKMVYVDFWATWCGPCCAEIPFVEKAVEKYKGNPNIKFVSVSLDDNQDKWLKKLATDNPAWEQYIIPENFDSEFAKQYNINAIPRFMLFDAEGKIITINAPRPSAGAEFDNLFK